MATWPASISTATSGGLAQSSDFNNHATALQTLSDASPAYVVTWGAVTTAPTIGASTLTGNYLQIGKWIDYRIRLTIGAGFAAGSGGWTFSLPSTASGMLSQHDAIGIASCFDTSSGSINYRNAALLSGTAIVIRDQSGTAVNGTVPWTWAVGDRLTVTGRYEVA